MWNDTQSHQDPAQKIVLFSQALRKVLFWPYMVIFTNFLCHQASLITSGLVQQRNKEVDWGEHDERKKLSLNWILTEAAQSRWKRKEREKNGHGYSFSVWLPVRVHTLLSTRASRLRDIPATASCMDHYTFLSTGCGRFVILIGPEIWRGGSQIMLHNFSCREVRLLVAHSSCRWIMCVCRISTLIFYSSVGHTMHDECKCVHCHYQLFFNRRSNQTRLAMSKGCFRYGSCGRVSFHWALSRPLFFFYKTIRTALVLTDILAGTPAQQQQLVWVSGQTKIDCSHSTYQFPVNVSDDLIDSGLNWLNSHRFWTERFSHRRNRKIFSSEQKDFLIFFLGGWVPAIHYLFAVTTLTES